MERDEYWNRDMIYSVIFILVGIAAWIFYVFGFEKSIMFGIAIGFLPTGAGSFLIFRKSKNHSGLARNLRLEKEERNIFINSKAGHTAFWISYWYIVIVSVFSNVINVSMQRFSIFTLLLMPIVYFLFVAIYHRKY
ncbi:hypothetical protein [Desulfosporosinus metallidurans]|uniref:hypothetical protein n=1 Tax=Desulfosporosinus metallidurans TaxID=1888891 RepID=UPI00094D610A|nr:hypothetical protein [Desulfosporosinus metallidurans]